MMNFSGMLLGSYHTETKWNLIPKKRIHVSPPVPKTNYVSMFGSNGKLNLSTVPTGYMTYENRVITGVFTTMKERSQWSWLYTDILNCLHGQELDIILDEDPFFYYTGVVTISTWETFEKTGEITITCDVEPYKKFIHDSADGFNWSDLSYGKRSGVFSNDQTGTVTGGSSSTYLKTIVIPVYYKGYYPEITVTKSGTYPLNVCVGYQSAVGLTLTDECTNKTFTVRERTNDNVTTMIMYIRYVSYSSSTTNDVTTFTVHARPRSL